MGESIERDRKRLLVVQCNEKLLLPDWEHGGEQMKVICYRLCFGEAIEML